MRAESTWTDAVVRATRDVTPNIRQIEFALERGQAVWTAGSHIDIGVMVDGRADTRSYSLVGEPDAGCYRVAVKREEQSRGGSRFMWSLKPGSRLSVSAPKNLFELQVGRPEYLLVAGRNRDHAHRRHGSGARAPGREIPPLLLRPLAARNGV